ncbi:MAG TPA: DUF4190 domain-containing protein [Ktedonobacterales bacterium]
MSYNDPEPTPYSAPPPPLDPSPAQGRADNYGWQGQQPYPPQQPYQQPSQTYQQPSYQPYGQPSANYYQGPMAPATSGYAIASLICSLLGYIGVFGFGPLLGVIFGHLALREIDRSNGALQGRGIAQAGLILGYIALGLALLLTAIFAIIFIVGAGATILSPNG